MKKYILVLLILLNFNFLYSQTEGENKEKLKVKNKSIVNVIDSTEIKRHFQQEKILKDSISSCTQKIKMLNDSIKDIIESANNLVEIYNYKKGFNERYFSKKDFENRLYDPSKDDNWRFDADIELAKLFIYSAKDKNSIEELKNVIYTTTIKKQLYEANKIFENKPDSILIFSTLSGLREIKKLEVSTIVNKEINRIIDRLENYQIHFCELREDLIRVNRYSHENKNFMTDFQKAIDKYNYSDHFVKLINGIKKQKVPESYFLENFGTCPKTVESPIKNENQSSEKLLEPKIPEEEKVVKE